MPEYLNNIKNLYDMLANSSRTCEDTNMINTAIDKLGAEYEGLVTSLHI